MGDEGNWKIDRWDRPGKPSTFLFHTENYRTTMEIDRGGCLAVRIEHDFNAPDMTAAIPVAQVIHLLTLHGYRVVLPGGRPASPSSDTAGKEK
jgi:hypothetical protein